MNLEIIRDAGDRPLYVYRLGDGQRSTILVAGVQLPDMGILDKVNVVVDESIKSEFRDWVGDNLVDDVAKKLGASKAKVGRLREVLGVQKYKKSGTSDVTIWRQGGSLARAVRCRGVNFQGNQCQRYTRDSSGFCVYHIDSDNEV